MMRLFLSVLTIVLFFSSAAYAYIRDYSEVEHLWKSEANNAYASGKTTFEDNTTIIDLFMISFEKSYDCRPVFKISFLDDNEYGKPLKTLPIEAGFLKLYVDNKLIYDGPVVNVVRSNATEFGATLSPEMLNNISNDNLITIELVDKMDIRFNLKGSKAHIDKAQKSCVQE